MAMVWSEAADEHPGSALFAGLPRRAWFRPCALKVRCRVRSCVAGPPASVPGMPWPRCPGSPRGPAPRCPGAGVLRDVSWPGSGGVVHDPVVAAAGPGAAGAGAVPGEHLRGGPPVQLHQVPFGSAAVEPGVAEVVPEPVRVHGHPALPAAAGDDLVDPGSGQRPPVARAEPQLRPVRLRVPGPGPQVAVQAAGRLMADLDGPGGAALAADPDLPALQVKVAAGGVAGVVADPGQLREPDAGRGEHRDDRRVAARGERPALAGLVQFR